MRQKIPILMLLVLMFAGPGCKTTIEPGGVHQGDAILFRAEQAIVETKDAMDAFLLLEHENAAVFSKWPEVKEYADTVRVDGRVWLESAMALRDTYKADPSEANRTKLQTSLALLRTMLAEIATHLARQTIRNNPTQ